MSANHSTSHIVQSLFANLAIAIAKGVAAVFTGSGAMLAEAIHSGADCTNQVLLLVGVNRSRRPPDVTHPLGYGREAYFWSFMVAMLLFAMGGAFSIYEGVHKTMHPEPVDNVLIGIGVLVFALLLEGGATLSNIREIRRRRGKTGFFSYLRRTKDSDLIVVFGENAAATLGLLVALAALLLAWQTGNARFDGLGSLLVGIVLVAVAIFLAVEVKSLLLGEAADVEIEEAVRASAQKHGDRIAQVLRVLTVQQGPGEVMVAVKLKMRDHLTGVAVGEAINAFERDLQERRPEVRWSFVEPDLRDDDPVSRKAEAVGGER